MTEEHEITRLQWAAMMIALDVDTCGSILRGLRVRAGNLDVRPPACAPRRPVQEALVPVLETGANPHGQRDVPVAPVQKSRNGTKATEEAFVLELIDVFHAVEVDPETAKCLTCAARVPRDHDRCQTCETYIPHPPPPGWSGWSEGS